MSSSNMFIWRKKGVEVASLAFLIRNIGTQNVGEFKTMPVFFFFVCFIITVLKFQIIKFTYSSYLIFEVFIPFIIKVCIDDTCMFQ